MLTGSEINLIVQSSMLRLSPSSARRIETALRFEIRWPRVLRIAALNRVAPLMARTLRDARFEARVPDEARGFLHACYDGCRRRAEIFAEEVARLLDAFRTAGVRVVLVRGLALGESLYHDTALRPFADVDLLVLSEETAAAKAVMRALGYRSPASALPDAYFERHHLHLVYTRRLAQMRFDVELHWSLDHKYTRWLVDYAALFERARPTVVAGTEVLLPSEEDHLLTLVIHLVKHNYFAPALWRDSDYAAAVLAEGGLIWHCDVAEFLLQRGGSLAWDRLVNEARRWNVGRALSAGLYSTASLFGPDRAPFPRGVVPAPRTLPADWLRAIVGKAALRPRRSLWIQRLAGKQAEAIFRPVRALDLVEYAFPGRDYLRRRYRWDGLLAHLALPPLHAVRVLGEIMTNAVDYVIARSVRRRR